MPLQKVLLLLRRFIGRLRKQLQQFHIKKMAMQRFQLIPT